MSATQLNAELEWQSRAACVSQSDADFFPERGGKRDVAAAKAVCAGCPVRAECLDYALDMRVRFGIWGGLTTPERRDAARRRQHASS